LFSVLFFSSPRVWEWGLNWELRTCKAGALTLSHTSSTFWSVYFDQFILEMGISRTICSGWPKATILLISAFQVARITGVHHCHRQVYAFLFSHNSSLAENLQTQYRTLTQLSSSIPWHCHLT
jgi:hypothetical protein